MNITSKIKAFLNAQTKPTEAENTYTPKVRIQSTVDYGKGLSFNEKAEHIFNQIKLMK